MRLPGWLQRRRIAVPASITALSAIVLLLANAAESPLHQTVAQRNWLTPNPTPPKQPISRPDGCPAPADPDPLLGPRTREPCVGYLPVPTVRADELRPELGGLLTHGP